MTLEGLQKTLAIKGYLNLGLSDEIKINFPGAAAPAASFGLAAVAVVVATAPQRTNQIGYLIRGRFVGHELNSGSRSRFASPTGAVAPVGRSR